MNMKKENKFAITFPPGWATIFIALGIVYNWKLAWITLAMLVVLFTIIENLKNNH
jgi:ABC-type bacteriocin/lantibiotic exporter with double-glycine peptidase domain